MKASFLLSLGLLAMNPWHAGARGVAEHVVVVVWDGMRPDYVTPQYAPTLYELANRGTFFKNHHSAYISSTEVNGTVLATGMHLAYRAWRFWPSAVSRVPSRGVLAASSSRRLEPV